MAPNLDFILSKDGYSPIPWSKSRTNPTRERFLRGEANPKLQSVICDTCIKHNSKTYCNAIYNCGFRRILMVEQREQQWEQQQQHHEDQELTTTTTTTDTTSTATATNVASKVQTQFTSACTAQLIELSANVMLQDSCRKAVAGSVCETAVM